MKKYFIVYQTIWNGKMAIFNGIYLFKFNIMKDKFNLADAEKQIAKQEFGDKRDITIINIIKA